MEDGDDNKVIQEPKHVAYRRLLREGRYDLFLKKKAEIKADIKAAGGKSACRMNNTQIFYAALEYFPPLETID